MFSSPKKTTAWQRLHLNSQQKIAHRIELDSPCTSPSPPRKQTNVEWDLLLRHEVSNIKKAIFKEKLQAEEESEHDFSPKINNYSRLLALKVIENEKDLILKLAIPRCYITLKKAVEKAQNRPRTEAERITSRSLSPYFKGVSFKAGCDVDKMMVDLVQKKKEYGLLKAT